MERSAGVLLLLLVPLLFVSAMATIYQECGSTAEIHDFTISNCDIPPCRVHRPSEYNVNITFTPGIGSVELNTIIEATILGETFPFPGPEGCALLEGDMCPLQAGRRYKYSAYMPVLADYPAVSVVVTWKLQDEKNNVHFCGMLPIVLV